MNKKNKKINPKLAKEIRITLEHLQSYIERDSEDSEEQGYMTDVEEYKKQLADLKKLIDKIGE